VSDRTAYFPVTVARPHRLYTDFPRLYLVYSEDSDQVQPPHAQRDDTMGCRQKSKARFSHETGASKIK
jgi:hypothetical protein